MPPITLAIIGAKQDVGQESVVGNNFINICGSGFSHDCRGRLLLLSDNFILSVWHLDADRWEVSIPLGYLLLRPWIRVILPTN
jgi:hypothetical protein